MIHQSFEPGFRTAQNRTVYMKEAERVNDLDALREAASALYWRSPVRFKQALLADILEAIVSGRLKMDSDKRGLAPIICTIPDYRPHEGAHHPERWEFDPTLVCYVDEDGRVYHKDTMDLCGDGGLDQLGADELINLRLGLEELE